MRNAFTSRGIRLDGGRAEGWQLVMWLNGVKQYVLSIGNNFGTLVPGRIYHGSEPSRERLVELMDGYGIKRVLNLIEGDQSKNETIARSFGLGWYPVPMSDCREPTVDEIRKLLALLRDPTPVYMHCVGGRHRTGLGCAVKLVCDEGWTLEQAWRYAVKKCRFYPEFGHQPLQDWFWSPRFNPADYR